MRLLVDDGPIYTEMVSGQGVSQLCDLAGRLADHVIIDPEAKIDLKEWTGNIKGIAVPRNQLLHAGYLGSEDDAPGRSLIIEVRGKRRVPAYAMTASIASLLELAGRIDEVSERGIALTGRLVAGYVGRGQR